VQCADEYPRFFWSKVEPFIGDALVIWSLRWRAGNGLPTSTAMCSRLSTVGAEWGPTTDDNQRPPFGTAQLPRLHPLKTQKTNR
jgi:hypothetical protein